MIRVTDQRLNIEKALSDFTAGSTEAGAITTFLGLVRGEKGSVDSLCLEDYPGVTEAGIAEAENKARTKWPLQDVLILHRIGEMHIGEPIVFVAVASKHRRAAFEACDFLMDYLKTEAVFWKKQTGHAGTQWIEPQARDYKDAQRWS
ncbi:MAG TPA: molybdenum cofactor biosynthesis protein MoaE [Hellea balneolensis]|uniref:Molybdopterin synthase catalytic subunit n=1 Tax=Hellea balneolensis TaxID=287478 RepID=A0A7C5LY99_9PROT|nr:molybdenum cofactor biosynthesis protein MoaE [Hellea balneolensis]